MPNDPLCPSASSGVQAGEDVSEEEAALEECPFKPKNCNVCTIAWHWVGWRRDDGTISDVDTSGPRVGYCGACGDPG